MPGVNPARGRRYWIDQPIGGAGLLRGAGPFATAFDAPRVPV